MRQIVGTGSDTSAHSDVFSGTDAWRCRLIELERHVEPYNIKPMAAYQQNVVGLVQRKSADWVSDSVSPCVDTLFTASSI